MDHERLIARLAGFPTVLETAAAVSHADDARWKPPSGAWSILEIVNHLLDEERDDFRARLHHVLEGSGSWPPIDPEAWARERRYNERELAESVESFRKERHVSVQWLRSIGAGTDWSCAYAHPKFGPIHAGDLLAAWCAHDALHLRQLAKRLFELAGRDAGPFGTRYAGDWGP